MVLYKQFHILLITVLVYSSGVSAKTGLPMVNKAHKQIKELIAIFLLNFMFYSFVVWFQVSGVWCQK